MADEYCRLAFIDDLRQPAAFEVFGDEPIDRAWDQAVPAAEPVARTADDGHNAFRIIAIEAGCVLDKRGNTAVIGEEVAEVMWNLGTEYIAARLQRGLGQVVAVPAAEAAGRRDAFARQADVLEDSQGVGHVVGEFIGGFVLAPAGVLDVVAGPLRIGPAGLEVDDPGVAYHLRMYVPVRQHEFADELKAVVQLLLRPAGKAAVQPADAGRVRDDGVLALYTVLMAPLAELAHERIGYFARQFFPILLVPVRPGRGEVRDAEVGHIHKAGRIIDNKTDRHPVLWIEHSNIGSLSRPFALVLSHQRSAADNRSGAGGCHRCYLYKIASTYLFLLIHIISSYRLKN